ncbi:TonB-dependent receptor [Burkholderia ubonensis]|uniref:TonB-dependent siderophore receptor n=1 Tax=Burkholderia ubonensis TaxID=101571 RepID=UPI000757D087|nr:TonB-dependent siderophore receptor [Burkholderia ubonensis]KWC33235.1 TonB-dependent receptor [Burkholderia ubonensis]KWC38290.1 TonB-dependent receptor [Burkholderia ubonensis]
MTVNRRRMSPALRRRACVGVGIGVGLGITLFAAQAGAASVDASASASDADAASGGGTLPAISVSGARGNALHARTASVAGHDDAPLRDTPASVSVVTRALLDDQQAKRLSDVVRNDASVSNAYAPVGYFEGFSIRGFPVDLASAIRIDGLTVSGEQNVPLENKERVEILKGLAGIDSGVVAPGGVINFVTKRSANVASVTTGVDSRGSTSAAMDLGRRFGPDNQFGIRINAAKENMHSYIDGTNGRRTFGSIAADWDISPRASLQFNAEFQQWIQRSAPGYQLLGGTVVPSVKSTSKALGTQPWAKPVTTDALNLNARFDYQFNDDWKAYVAAGRSRTMIDDNSAFAYGCSYAASCAAGATSPFFFGRNGDYDVYDFRSPGEYRRNDDVRAVTTGKFATGPVRHELTVGTSVQRRVVHMADAVYDYVGSENIYGPDVTLAPSPNVPGPSYPRLDAWQYAVFGADRISFGDHWQVLAGGKEVLLRQRSWSSLDGPQARTDRSVFLPQVALVYKPVNALSLYASYSKALSLGDQAPVRATNAYAFLPPVESRQIEVGAKYDWLDRLSLTAAVFSISKPFQFAQPDASNGSYTFVQRGTQRHQGIELGAAGQVTQRLSLTATVAAIRARAYDSGSPAYEGHQVINVPALRASLYADYAVPGVAGLALLGGVDYSASRNANEEGTARVPAWFVFNLGARYATKIGGHRTVLRVSVDNLFNKFYWRDAGEQQGDAYLFPGAPRTARVSLTYDF